MAKRIGTLPHQIPLNLHLGKAAFMDPKSVTQAAGNVLGVGQKRTDVTALYSDTDEQVNNTGGPIIVMYRAVAGAAGDYVGIDSPTTGFMAIANASATGQLLTARAVVLPGETYRYQSSGTLSSRYREEVR